MTRVATPETEARLLAVGRSGTAAHVERIVRGWRLVDRKAEAREAKQRHKSRALHVYEPRPDGALRFRRPNGDLLPDVPMPTPVPADPVGALRARHSAERVSVDSHSLRPNWLGERLDLGWAIDVLHPLAQARKKPGPSEPGGEARGQDG